MVQSIAQLEQAMVQVPHSQSKAQLDHAVPIKLPTLT